MEMKEWFVVYQYDRFYPHEGSSVRAIDEVFIYGEGTAQDAWLEYRSEEYKLISITRV